MTRRARRAATALTLLTGLAALGACGSDAGTPGARGTATATTAAPGRAGVDPGSFPDRPQLLLRFDERAAGWPRSVRRGAARGGYDDEGFALELPAGAPALRVAAARRLRPATRGVLLETTVRLPARGGAGLFCRGSSAQAVGYALTVERRGRWTIERFEDGRAQRLGSGPLARQAAKGTLLRFVCGAAAPGRPLTLGYQVGATPLQFVKDPSALAPRDASSAGILARPAPDGPASASFDYFAASVAT